ncbi:MAG: hypothetical protein EBQ80_02470 [Proteobacteria bacterium]|nr:hypothetical protein [Pseudomonadota bacterium]
MLMDIAMEIVKLAAFGAFLCCVGTGLAIVMTDMWRPTPAAVIRRKMFISAICGMIGMPIVVLGLRALGA